MKQNKYYLFFEAVSVVTAAIAIPLAVSGAIIESAVIAVVSFLLMMIAVEARYNIFL